MAFLRRLSHALAARPVAPTRPDLPVQAGPGPCQTCWVRPGVEHELSCDRVSPEQFRALMEYQTLMRGAR